MANYSHYDDGKQAGVLVRFEALQGAIILVETHYNQNLGGFCTAVARRGGVSVGYRNGAEVHEVG